MMGESTGNEERKRMDEELAAAFSAREVKNNNLQEEIDTHKRYLNQMRRDNYILLGIAIPVTAVLAAAAIFYTIKGLTTPPQYISSSRVDSKPAELDPAQEGLEQLLTIDGKPYTLQKRNGEPILVKYEKKD